MYVCVFFFMVAGSLVLFYASSFELPFDRLRHVRFFVMRAVLEYIHLCLNIREYDFEVTADNSHSVVIWFCCLRLFFRRQ